MEIADSQIEFLSPGFKITAGWDGNYPGEVPPSTRSCNAGKNTLPRPINTTWLFLANMRIAALVWL